MTLPWQLLFTTERDGQAEVSVSGILTVVRLGLADPAGAISGIQHPLLTAGDQAFDIWSRSLLKPFKLLCHLPVLEAHYPNLTSEHYALMLSSQNGEPRQIERLSEILDIGGISAEALQCPETYPMAEAETVELKLKGKLPQAIYHPCAGKHLATILSLKAAHQPYSNYLEPAHELHETFKQLIGFLLQTERKFPLSLDGCNMPCLGLTAPEIATLFGLLARPLPEKFLQTAPDNLKPALSRWNTLRDIIQRHPMLLGGKGRLDSWLISSEFTESGNLAIFAKEGADGLLGVGIFNRETPEAATGVFIKLASGYDPKHLETLLTEILRQLQLVNLDVSESSHIRTRFAFTLEPGRLKAPA